LIFMVSPAQHAITPTSILRGLIMFRSDARSPDLRGRRILYSYSNFLKGFKGDKGHKGDKRLVLL
jgi:hypothetical protein